MPLLPNTKAQHQPLASVVRQMEIVWKERAQEWGGGREEQPLPEAPWGSISGWGWGASSHPPPPGSLVPSTAL